VRAAARKMANKGLYHADLSIRHVGKESPVKPKEEPNYIFFDLRSIENCDPDEAFQKMLMDLNLIDDQNETKSMLVFYQI